MRLFEPRKEIFGSTYFEIIFLWCAAVQQQENIFHGGEFPRTHMHLKPKEKMTHDPWLFEGVVFFSQGWEQGFVCIVIVTTLDLHRSDIRTGIYSSTFLDTGSWISVCNEVTLPISILIGTIISPAALIIFPGAQVQKFRNLLEKTPLCQRAPKLQNSCFCAEDIFVVAKGHVDIYSSTNEKNELETFRAAI